MKRILIPTITFVLGAALGVAVMFFVVQRGPNQVIANILQQYTSQQAVCGALLHEKRYDDLQLLMEDGFAISLNLQKYLNFSPDGYHESQKSVRAYFDLTGRPIPSAINQNIETIPKGTGINLLRVADFELAHRAK